MCSSDLIGTAYTAEFKNQTRALLLAATVDFAKIEVCTTFLPDTVKTLRAGNANTMLFSFWKEFFSGSVFKRLFETALKATMEVTSIALSPAYTDSAGVVTYRVDKIAIDAAVEKRSAALVRPMARMTVSRTSPKSNGSPSRTSRPAQ